MVVSGIVCELNPFHNGHKYIFEKARKMSGADYIIAVMSGDFVQRGQNAICDKYTRSKMALLGGADLVIEIPTIYATASADYYAYGAVSLLDSLNCIDYLCFGSESCDLNALNKYVKNSISYDNEAHILSQGLRESRYNDQAINYLREGKSFAKAEAERHGSALGSNDMLAACYLKSLEMLGSNIKPLAVKRNGSEYLDIRSQSESAMAIRKRIRENQEFAATVPKYAFECLKEAKGNDFPIYMEDFSAQLFTRIDSVLSEEYIGLSDYMDVSVNLSGRIKANFNDYLSYCDFIDSIHSKEYTKSRIMRALLHILLGIRKDIYQKDLKECLSPYARILGFKRENSEILSLIKEKSVIPVISKAKDAERILDDDAKKIFDIDVHCANLYEQCCAFKFNRHPIHEFSKEIIIL